MPEDPAQTVFVVDDDSAVVWTLVAVLNGSGFSAKGFESAEDAIQAAESGCPVLLITDVAMPCMNGIELAILFKFRWPSCKVMLFSGQATTMGLLDVARVNGHNFRILEKPVHPSDLMAAIRKL